jgi:hypothetical protein
MHHTTILIACFISIVSSLITINGKFKHCLLTEPMHYIALDSLCEYDGDLKQLFELSDYSVYSNCKGCPPTWNGLLRPELMPGRIDYEKRHMLATIASVACSSLFNTISSQINSHDRFIVLSVFSITDAVIYIKNGLPYLPICSDVSTIQVLETTDACYRDFAVKYKVGSNEVNGFLRDRNILSQFSEIVDCKTNDKNLVIEGSSVKLKRKNRGVISEDFDTRLATKPFLQNGFLNDIFQHNQL